MSETTEPQSPEPQPPYVIPVRYTAAPAPVAPLPPRRPVWTAFLIIALIISVVLNLIALAVHQFTVPDESGPLVERFHSGKAGARDKIAIVKLDGVIMEGTLGFVQKQIDQAAADPAVKAVVLRISSPGGTITGSDDLHRRIVELRDGTNPQQKGGKKTLVVSMGAMAASGGYYIAVPAEQVLAEPTTITGSIGVYAAFPNIAGLAKELGFGMNVIKAGDIKDSGSMFKDMTPQERQVWQDMVNHAYARFKSIVDEGRGAKLKFKLGDVVFEKEIPDADGSGKPNLDENGKPKMVKYVRRLADGGIWTADEAEKFGLVDKIGYLDVAIGEAAQLAKSKGILPGSYQAVTYDRPVSLVGMLLGIQAPQPGSQLDAGKLAAGATPRLWYLTPQSEMAGILSAIGKE